MFLKTIFLFPVEFKIEMVELRTLKNNTIPVIFSLLTMCVYLCFFFSIINKQGFNLTPITIVIFRRFPNISRVGFYRATVMHILCRLQNKW